jgi:GNAT superfamily N-acetyltransferase
MGGASEQRIVRQAGLADSDGLFELVRSFPTPTPCDRPTFEATLETKLRDSSSFVGVAEANARLIGYVAGYSHLAFYAGGRTAWVDELFVLAESQGQGVGRRLMETFEQWAASQQCRLVSLATSGAALFYQRLGYESKAGYFKKYMAQAMQGAVEQRDAPDSRRAGGLG